MIHSLDGCQRTEDSVLNIENVYKLFTLNGICRPVLLSLWCDSDVCVCVIPCKTCGKQINLKERREHVNGSVMLDSGIVATSIFDLLCIS